MAPQYQPVRTSPNEKIVEKSRQSKPTSNRKKWNWFSRSKARHDVGSPWRIGWSAPLFIIASYLLALIVSIVHVIFFRYLNGKEASGPNRVIRQSYVTTTSNVFATVFQVALQVSLSTVFVQYLWHVLRIKSLRISVIEDMFLIRSSPLKVFKISVWKNAPILLGLTFLIWSIYISTSFPPGAISVETVPHSISNMTIVPTFNASFMGDGSGIDAESFNLDTIFAGLPGGRNGPTGTVTSYFLLGGPFSPYLQRMANTITVGGSPSPIPSPCGANCSYALTFDGPIFECNQSQSQVVYGVTDVLPIYSGFWANPSNLDQVTLLPLFGPLTFSTYTNINPTPVPNGTGVEQSDLVCSTARATYLLVNSYKNNVQTINITTSKIEPLVYFNPDLQESIPAPAGLVDDMGGFGTVKAEFNQSFSDWYRDLNLMNIIGVATGAIVGSYLPDGTSWTDPTTGGTWNDGYDEVNGPKNGSLIGNSQFNSYIDTFQTSAFPAIAFNVTEDKLNSLLRNVTISAIPTYKYWNTTANVTYHSSLIIYSFSSPRSIYLPYGLTLVVALPFIALGFWALNKNGVAAIDGGFTQLVRTSTGSKALEREALAGCLGGPDIPEGLKNLRVRFGELRDTEVVSVTGARSDVIAKAGFGTEDELLPLRKGVQYGRIAKV